MVISKKNNQKKYLLFDRANWNKEVFKKDPELWDGIKNEIETINDRKSSEYGKDFMKMKFDSDDDLPLSKQLKFPTMTIVARSDFENKCWFYLQVY